MNILYIIILLYDYYDRLLTDAATQIDRKNGGGGSVDYSVVVAAASSSAGHYIGIARRFGDPLSIYAIILGYNKYDVICYMLYIYTPRWSI